MRRAILLTVLLAGCAHAPEPPEIDQVPVPAPTPVPCVDPAQIPPEPPTVGHRFNGDAKHDLLVLAPNARALREWGQELRALLDACVAEAPGSETAGSEAAEPDPGDSEPAESGTAESETREAEAAEGEPAEAEAAD